MSRALPLLVPALLSVVIGGCEVAAVESVPRPTAVNRCESQDDCGPPTVATCQSGRCIAPKGAFSTILLDISVPASSAQGSGLSYLWREDSVNLAGEEWDIQLAPVAVVKGTVKATSYTMDPALGTLCELAFVGDDASQTVFAGTENTIPVHVSFTPADRILGVASAGYSAAVDTSGSNPELPLEFTASVPPGEYDIYVEPRAPAEGGCDLPPHLLRRRKVESGGATLDLDLPEPSRFDLTVEFDPSANSSLTTLDGWTVDMLDPVSGKVISTKAPLAPSSSGVSGEFQAALFYFPVPLDGDKSELVRLSPPADTVAPTILLARSALELFSQGSGVVDQFRGYPRPVRVQGQVTFTSEASLASAEVTLMSKTLDGVGDGVFASFVRTLEVGPEGTFEIDLLPGSYQVLAVPGGTGSGASGSPRTFAATETEWTIAAEPSVQAGRAIALQPIIHVVGTAFVPGGEPALGSLVSAVASPRQIRIDPLTRATEASVPFAPSAQSSLVDEDGSFDIEADPGEFDISVRPPDDSGFGWFVSHVLVKPPTDGAAHGLGSFKLPYPVPYRGQVRVLVREEDPSNPNNGTKDELVGLSQALIRAYVYLDETGAYIDDPTKAASVVQIGETRAFDDGQFELLIPANLN